MSGQATHDELDAFLAGLPDDRWAMVMRYREIEARGQNPRLAAAIDTMLAARPDDAMPEADRKAAQRQLFNLIQTATAEGSDQVQVYMDRIWGRLNPDQKRQLATNASAAPAIVMEALRNDPMLAPRIVVQLDQPSGRGIEHYQGSAAAGAIGGQFASLRAQDAARAAEARQYADLRLSSADVGALASIGMDRVLYDHYRQMGFTQGQIIAAAHDAEALGFNGRADIDIAVRAPSDLRTAAAAIARARTDEERAAAQRRYDELARTYQDLPDSDPRKQDALRFIERVQQQNLHQVREIGADAARAASHSQQLATADQAMGRQAETVRATLAATTATDEATRNNEQASDAMFADLGLDPAPTQQAETQPAATRDTKITAGETNTADVATSDPAGKIKVARAPVRLPTATV